MTDAGEGRSKDENATMTFKESFEDLKIFTPLITSKMQIYLPIVLVGSSGLYLQISFLKSKTLTLAGALFTQQENL